MVAVELDGAAWHGSQSQRERAVRRDAQLAALGIVVVRFTHHRLHHEPDRVIDELLSILAARRRQLAS
jgi:very-short-patch-repair endonuclease